MQDKIRMLNKRRAGSGSDDSEGDDDDNAGATAGGSFRKKRPGPSYLEQELSKYSSGRRGKKQTGKRNEEDVMALLSSFQGKIRKGTARDRDDVPVPDAGSHEVGEEEDEEGMEVDDDYGFFSHSLVAYKESDAERTRRAEDEYVVSREWMSSCRSRMSARLHGYLNSL